MKSVFVRILCASFLWACGASASAQVVISEFMADNTKTLADQDGEYSDWIELHNPGATEINLGGWYLTDSAGDLTKWRFPVAFVPANGYLIVFASGKDRALPNAQLHTSFSLSADGEYLALVQPDGNTIASEFAPEFPEQHGDISYGRFGSENFYFDKPSPGAANAEGFVAFAATPKLSHNRGFYDASFVLNITTETPGATIRYSTNGITPSTTNGVVFSGPITIDHTTVLRAAAFKDGYQPSPVDTQTYVFLDDVIRQASDGRAPAGWPTSWGSNTRDYGMDPDVVNNPTYSSTIKQDLKTIPSFSVVMDLKDLFSSSTGIYANPGQDGRAWERPCSLELIHPDGMKEGFQINAGIRIRGGFSRSTGNPKHALRFFFRDEYGDAKLKYPLFGKNGTDTFDALDLRTFQNYSWSFQGDSRGIFVRDQFSRDTQLDMGHQGERGDYCHLYINGMYWGLYNTCERPEASFGATYYGGDKEDFDVIKVEAGPYSINATDGNMTAWTQLYNLCKAGLTNNAAYFRIQGLNPDGTPSPDYPNLVDAVNLIDYMLVIVYGGNLDAPISNFLGNTSPNNWYGMRNRSGPDGFRFFAHDAEHTLLNLNENRVGPFPAGDSSVTKSNPQWVWQKMWANQEFRILCADRIHRHFFNSGALTPQAARSRFDRRTSEIDRAVVGESARWGDAKTSPPLTRANWISAVNNVRNNFLPRRSDIVLTQLKNRRLYPAATAPSFNQHGGNIEPGFSLTISAPAGAIYYTMDGSDPRVIGGALSPAARPYSGPVALRESVRVKSRVLAGSDWSALNEADFTIAQHFKDLLVTEIMYNPPTENGQDGDDFEFVELKNVSSERLDLSNVRFTEGINFAFAVGTEIEPGGFVVLVSNPSAFLTKYPTVPVAGTYLGHLSNGGEKITLVHATGEEITSIDFKDSAPWPSAADGSGFSLVPLNPNLNPDPNEPANWRASSTLGGSPGTDDTPLVAGFAIINEISTHSDPVEIDQLELFNPTPNPVDLSNWYLTDDRTTPKKFRIPAGTVLPAGGYRVFSESDFNPNPGVDPSFSLSSHGEEVYLFSADAAGNLTGFSDGFSFGASANGVSFGRYTNSVGEIHYPAEQSKTLGAANAGPSIGPIVINEIQYHPLSSEEEFIELKNITGNAWRFYDMEHPTNRWRLEGVSFEFPPDFELAPNGLLVVANTDPAAFRSRYGIPGSVPVLGPYAGSLQDNGELLRLLRPDSPDTTPDGAQEVPYLVVDEVRYNDAPPWPANAAGFGPSLERITATAYGNDPVNWRASFGTPSPGVENGGNRAPRVNAGPDQTTPAASFPATASLAGTATDDGQPNPPGSLITQWTQVSGPGPVLFANANQLATTVSFPGVGTYVLRLSADDGAVQASDELSVAVERASSQVTLVAPGSAWKYWDAGTDLGTAWREPGFNDAAWPSGRAQLGFGDGDETTTVGFGPNGNDKYRTTYFRRMFNGPDAASVTALTIRVLRDDGAVAYINGKEVFRSNMPEDDISFDTFASAAVSGEDESSNFYDSAVDPAVLVSGANVLAVEIHQVNPTSSDLSFDLELSGLARPANEPPTASAGPDLTVVLAVAAELKGTGFDDGLPIPPGKLSASWSKVSGPGNVVFTDANALNTSALMSEPGSYVLRLAVTDGALSAQDDLTVTVTNELLEHWKATHFTASELADPDVGGDNADPDRDGHTNLQEFNVGTNPRDAQSVFRAVAVYRGADGRFRLQFNTEHGRSYTVQFLEALGGGGWQRLMDLPPGPAGHPVEITDPAYKNSRYYRIVTPRQP